MLKHCMSIFSLCVVLLCHFRLAGQDQPANDPEKFVFYEIVRADSTTKALLYHNAVSWVTVNGLNILQADSLQGIIKATNEFPVYKESGVLRKISGKVTYTMVVEVKDNRYRYHLNDFIFHYYGPDRYYNMIPTGKKKKLDDADASGWQKLWDSHRIYTTQKIQQDIASLKIKIIEKPVSTSTQSPKQKKTITWD